jgi:hypothetical protein
MSNWLSTTNANRLRQSYLNGFLDISGDFTLRSGSSTIFNDLNLQTYDKNNFDSSFANVWNNYLNSSPYTWQNISISATGQYQVAIQRSYVGSDTNGNIWISNNYGIQNSWIDTNVNTIQSTSSRFQNIVISENGQYITAVSNPTGSTVGNNIYRSSDFGQTWTINQTVLLTGEKMITAAISATGQYQAIITETSNPTTGKIWISQDYGSNWSNTRTISNGISSLAISANGQYQILSQKGQNFTNTSGNIFYSTTYGITWIDSNFQISNFPSFNFDLNQTVAISYDGKYQTVLSLAQSSSNSPVGNIYINDNYGVGSSWKDSGVGAPVNTYLRSVSLSGSGKYQIVSTMSETNTGVLLLSKNYGKNWNIINPNPIPSSTNPNFSFVQSLSISANADYISGIIRVINNGSITAQGNLITSSIPSSYKSMFSLNYFGSDNKGGVSSNHPFNISLPNFSNSGLYLGYDVISDGTYINSLNENGSKNLLLQSQGGNIGIGNTNPQYILDISGNVNTAGDLNVNNIIINSNVSSTSSTNGALVVSGGVGISGNVNTAGNLNANNIIINSNVSSTSSTTGALIVSGGVGISGNVNTAGNLNANNIIINSNVSSTSSTNGALVVFGGVGISGNVNTAGNLNANNIIINSNVSSTSSTNGALVVSGGVGISGNVNTAGNLNANNIIINSNLPSTSSTTGALIVSGGVGISGNVNTAGNLNANNIIINSNLPSTSFNTGALIVSGGVGISGNVNTAGNLNANNIIINSNLPSTSSTTGALIVSGGVGISGNVNIGGNSTTNNIFTNSISSIGVSLTINGNVTAPTMVYTDNSTRLATTQYVTTAITNINDYNSGYAGGGGNMFNRFYFANFTSRNNYTNDIRPGNNSNYCNSFAISNLNFVYAAVNNTNTNTTYYYRSIDYGNTWLDMSVNFLSSTIFSSDRGLLTCSQDGKNVVISLNNRIKYSSNYGITFTDYSFFPSGNPNIANTNLSIPACSYNGKYVFTVASPNTSNTIPYYAIDTCYNIFYPSTLINDSWPSILLNQTCDAGGKNVYTVGGTSNTSINRIFKSQDYGVSFNRIQNNFPFSISSIKCNKNGDIVYVSCGGYGTTIATSNVGPIYRSFDGGATFTIISPQNSNWSQVTCNNDGNLVIASAYGGNIQFSYNYGLNWNSINFTNNWSAIGSSPVGDLIVGGDFFTTQNFRITTFLPTTINTGNMNISDTTASTSNTTGALVVTGGMGISGAINGILNIGSDSSLNGNLIVASNLPKLRIIDTSNNRQPSIEFIRGTNRFGSSNFTNWRIVASGGLSDGSMSAVTAGSLSFYRESTTAPSNQFVGHAMTISDASGFVGIGITNPAYQLDVCGGAVRITSSDPQLVLTNTRDAYNGGRSSILFQSRTALNPMGRIECLDVAASPNAYNNDMIFYTGFNVALNERMRITGTGSVGIGMTPVSNDWFDVRDGNSTNYFYFNKQASTGVYDTGSSSHKWSFDSAGNLVAQTLRSRGRMFIGNDNVGGGGGDSAYMEYVARTGESCTLRMVVENDTDDHINLRPTGRVGIKTDTPVYDLDVAGSIISDSWVRVRGVNGLWFETYGRGIRAADAEGASYGNITTHGSGLSNWAGYDIYGRYTFMANGDLVGIHDRNNSWCVYFNNGSAVFIKQVTAPSYNANSDYRLKSNIQPITKTIDDLNPIEYDLSGGAHSMGFLAHEVQEHFPFLVTGEKDGETMQSINYNGFIALLVKEIQDLKSTVKTLQHRIEILESK